MRKNNFSNVIYEYGTISQGEEYFKLSRHTLMRLAEAHNCVISIGSRNKRINIKKLSECLEKEQQED